MNKKLSRQLAIIIAALLVPIVPFVIIGELPGELWLSATDDDALRFALAGGGLLALDILLPVPSSIVATLLAARLGFWPGFITSWCGLLVGNMLGFYLARFAANRFRSWLPEFPESTTLALVFLSRPVPVMAEAMALAAGVINIPAFRFFLACAAGNLIYAAILAANGAAFLPGDLIGPGLAVPMLLPVIAWFVWRRMAAKHTIADEPPRSQHPE
jgi:uncharacterized membrane protein YdjX (TVP38/TMEM64 family)